MAEEGVGTVERNFIDKVQYHCHLFPGDMKRTVASKPSVSSSRFDKCHSSLFLEWYSSKVLLLVCLDYLE